MKRLIEKYWERIILSVVLVSVLLWFSSDHIKRDEHDHVSNLTAEMDVLTSRINHQLQLQRSMLEYTALNLYLDKSTPLDTVEIIKRMNPVIDRSAYKYSLFIAPSTVINGSDQISPEELLKQGKKKYGEKVYYGNPFYDGERKALTMPIYIQLNRGMRQNEAIVFTEVDASGLIRDFTRMSTKSKGQGFLIDSEGQITNLSLNTNLNSNASRIASSISEQGLLAHKKMFSYDGHWVFIRTLASTEISLIYIERMNYFLDRNIVGLYIASFLFILFFLFVFLELRKNKIGLSNDDLKSDINSCNVSNDGYLNISWFKGEAEQFRLLSGTLYSKTLLEFKMDYCLKLLSGELNDVPSFLSTDFTKWASMHVENRAEHVKFEVVEDMRPFYMSPEMVYAGVDILEYLIRSNLSGAINLKCDSENQILLFSCYGDLSQSLHSGALAKDLATHFSEVREAVLFKIVGSKIVLSMHPSESETFVVQEVTPGKKCLPEKVFFYENDIEQNAILKFYLDHMQMPYVIISSLKVIPENSVVLITESVYLSLIEADNIGVAMPYRFIICGDLTNVYTADAVVINRPYALDKLEYALTRIAQK